MHYRTNNIQIQWYIHFIRTFAHHHYYYHHLNSISKEDNTDIVWYDFSYYMCMCVSNTLVVFIRRQDGGAFATWCSSFILADLHRSSGASVTLTRWRWGWCWWLLPLLHHHLHRWRMIELRGRDRLRVGRRGKSSTIETCAASYLVLYPISYYSSMYSDNSGTGSIDDAEESRFSRP